jgi:ribonuclease HI
LRAGELLARFPRRTITHVPRELNTLADALVNRAIDDATGA